MNPNSVIFKGTPTGLILVLDPDVKFQEILDTMKIKFKSTERFFKGAILDVKYRGRDLTKEQEEMIFDLLNNKSGARITKLEKEEVTNGNAVADDEAVSSRRKPSYIKKTSDSVPAESMGMKMQSVVTDELSEGTKFFSGTLRSGQKIDYNGHVVVLGDINPGAEIIATGNVLVMGSLRGLVHAGCRGDRSAVIAAIRINPMQLRIADKITRPPEEGDTGTFVAYEVAHIKDDNIVIEEIMI